MRGLLGADIFVNLLLVFIITTGLLLMNSDKTGGETAVNKTPDPAQLQQASERELPKINLPRGNSGGAPVAKAGVSLTLSARKQNGSASYFLNEKRVTLEELRAGLLGRHVASVRIRFDKDLPYGLYIRVLEVCKETGVTEIINVYTKQ